MCRSLWVARSLLLLLSVMASSLAVHACAQPTPAATAASTGELVTLSGKTMGTTYTVKYVSTPETTVKPPVVAAGLEETLQTFNQIFSTYELTSELSVLNQKLSAAAAGTRVQATLSVSLSEALMRALAISRLTMGSFDVTVAPLVDLWGFGPRPPTAAGNVPIEFPSTARVIAARAHVGFARLQLNAEQGLLSAPAQTSLDFSAIAKGRGVDVLAEYLEMLDFHHYLVEIGGELRTRGTKPGGATWTLAIVHPEPKTRLVDDTSVDQLGEQTFSLSLPQAVRGIATSGNYHNYVEHQGTRYPHIIDPETAYPVTHGLASVTVVTSNCEWADALATALMVMGGERGLAFAEQQGLAVFFIEAQAGEWVSYASSAFAAYRTPTER